MKNLKRNIISLLLGVLLIMLPLTGCEGGGGSISSSEDALPDMSNLDPEKLVEIEFFSEGWIAVPCGDKNDPFKKYLDEKYNIDLKIITTKNFKQDIMLRASANDMPDLLATYDHLTMLALYEEGMLFADNNLLLDMMPTVAEHHISDSAKAVLTIDGKLALIPNKADRPLFTWKVRKDWLENLGIDPVNGLPKTDDELFELIKKLTFDDPDKNGKDDTFGITSAGANRTLGEIETFINMYGQPEWHVLNNEVSHPIINGDMKKILDFVKRLVDSKVIDPDFLTVDWNERKAPLYAGLYGMCYYPGVILGEEVTWGASEESVANKWINMPMPKMTETGGKYNPESGWSVVRAISADAAMDADKLDRITRIIDESSWPNEDYYKIRWGDELDYGNIKEISDGYKFAGYNNEPRYRSAAGSPGACDWGLFIATNYDGVYNINVPEPGPAVTEMIQLDTEALGYERYSGEWLKLTLDANTVQACDDLLREFQVKYILGQTSDYEAFVSTWLERGGQELLEEATEQFKELGLIE